MKKYFIAKGNDKIGPFSLEELKEKDITSETFIWYEGLSDWQKASSISELSGIISVPQPIQNQQYINPQTISTTQKNSTELFVFLAIAYWLVNIFINNIIDFIFKFSSIGSYINAFFGVIFAALPIIFALSIKENKTLRTIAIIIGVIIALNILYSNISTLFYNSYYGY